MSSPSHVYQVFINAPVAKVWQAIVDGDLTVRYFYGTRVTSDWSRGSTIQYLAADGSVVADGDVIAIDPPNRLEISFHARWDPELEAEGPVREAWIVEEANGVARLTVELYDMEPSSKTHADFTDGIAFIVSGLKTLLETGEPMATAGCHAGKTEPISLTMSDDRSRRDGKSVCHQPG